MADARDIAHYALGTCKSDAEITEHFGVGEEDVIELLLDANVERCDGCGWWFESGELVNDDGIVVGCDQCRAKEDD